MASIITAVAHGLLVDGAFKFANVLPTNSGVDEATTYYVLTVPTSDTLTFSESIGGTAFVLTNAITDGSLVTGEEYTVVSDGIMDPPDAITAPDAPTLESSVDSGIVRLLITVNTAPEPKQRAWEVQVTHQFDGATPLWDTPLTIVLPEQSSTMSIPALSLTHYAARVRAEDVYGQFSEYSSVFDLPSTVEGPDASTLPADSITEAMLQVDSISTRVLQAGAVTADILAATIVLSSLLQAGGTGLGTGRRVEIDSYGVRLVDASNVIIVNIPTDSNTPVYFKGDIVANSFSSTETNDLSGSVGLTGDGILTLANGVSAPVNAPSISAALDALTLTSSAQATSLGIAYDSAFVGGAVYWIACDPATGYVAHAFRASSGVLVSSVPATGSTTTTTTTSGSTSHVSDTWIALTGSTDSHMATPMVMPRDGRITKVSVYVSGYGGDASIRNGVWTNASGAGVGARESATYTAGGESPVTGNSNHHDVALTSSLTVAGGTTIYVGCRHTSSSDGYWWDRNDGSGKETRTGDGTTFDGTGWGVQDSSGKPNVYFTYEYDVDTRLETLPMIGAAHDGSYLYLLDTSGVVWKYDTSTLGYIANSAVQTAITGTKSKAGIFYDATADELIITTTTGTGAGVYPKAVRVDKTTLAVSSTVYSAAAGPTFSGTTDTFRGGARVADALNASAATYWLATTSAVYGYTFAGTTLTNTANRDFGTAATMANGLTYDGANFRGFAVATPTKVHKFTNWDWTTASAIYWAAYAWYDSAGTTHETVISPRSSLTLRRRERLLVQTPAIPSGGADDPNNARVYMKPNATDPGAGALKLQATDALTSRYLDTYDSGGAADGGGTPFAAGTPAEVRSSVATGSGGWSLKGSGLWLPPTGTSFPSGPATGQEYTRSDLANTLFFYDGTRWVSRQLFSINSSQEIKSETFFIVKSATTTRWQTADMSLPFGTDWYIHYLTSSFFISSGGTALSGSHKWVLGFMKGTASVPSTSLGTISIDSGSSNIHRNGVPLAVNALLDVTNNPIISIDATKTGTPGDMQLLSAFTVYARIVAT
jgi:hypothetical protein